MKTILLILALAASPVYAGGPVIEDTGDLAPLVWMEQTRPSSEGNWVLSAIAGLLIIAIASGGGDNCNGPDDVPPQDGGC